MKIPFQHRKGIFISQRGNAFNMKRLREELERDYIFKLIAHLRSRAASRAPRQPERDKDYPAILGPMTSPP
jgi:hypothetical protein